MELFGSRSRPLRIALATETYPPEVNGVAMTWGNLVNGLRRRGHEIQLIRPRQAGEDMAATRHGLECIRAAGVPIPYYPALRFGLISQRRLLRLWRDNRPDVVHVVTEGPLGRAALAAARRLQLPVTSSFHTNFHQYSSHYGMGRLRAVIETYLRRFHNRTLVTLAPTPALALALEDRGYRHTGVLARGVAIEQFAPARRSTALRHTWGAGERDVVVLYVGRLAREKNVGLVQTAFDAIRSRLPSAKLVWVGDGPLRDHLRAAGPPAIFAGVKTGAELAAHYASADLFLFPSLTETYGNVVPEALASGLVVVSYDCAAAAQLIVSGRNGVLVTPGDEPQFVSAAVDIALDTTRRAALRERAAPSTAHLSWTAVTDGLVLTLRAMIERHRAQLEATDTLLPAARLNLPSA